MTPHYLQELSEAEVADALSLAIVSGALGSSKGSTLSTSEAFAVAVEHSGAVAQSAIGLVAASGSPASPGFSQRVHLGVVVGSAVVSGLVAQNAAPAEALAQLDAEALELGRHRRIDGLVAAFDHVTELARERRDAAHEGAGDAEDVQFHDARFQTVRGCPRRGQRPRRTAPAGEA